MQTRFFLENFKWVLVEDYADRLTAMVKFTVKLAWGKTLSNQLRECSINIYEGIVGDFIGDVLHPGGLNLTAKMAEIAKIDGASTVLDLASGKGSTAKFLAENFGCNVVGLDLSANLVKVFNKGSAGLIFPKIEFTIGDAEAMPYIDSCFDVVMCECAFNLFQNKRRVLGEIYRVLKCGGRFALADIVLKKDMPAELKTKLTFALCVAGAETLSRLSELLRSAGFAVVQVEDHSEKLVDLGIKLLFSDSFTLGVEDQGVLERLFNEDLLSYVLIVSHKPGLVREV
ncbi:MAG: methyltransferase domain-containing protein [Candidatus Bathyarchaeia archaeon]